MVSDKKVQLIYAFNGVGKTRLSGEFKQLVRQQRTAEDNGEDVAEQYAKILYYNAFTEDLFYWDNDLENDIERKLIIRPNGFTEWILKDEGQENNIAGLFSHYTNSKLMPSFSPDYTEVTFSIPGVTPSCDNVKISKSEESSFIWCIFYSMLELVIEQLNTEQDNRSTDRFNQLKYIFIDDPVTSLDENHLIELAVSLVQLIKSSPKALQFIISTHNPLFYNVLLNEFQLKDAEKNYSPKQSKHYRLDKTDNDSYLLVELKAELPFAYHLYILSKIKEAINTNQIERYHFSLFRNILEKLAVFLGHNAWGSLLKEDVRQFQSRLINITSHSRVSNIESAEVSPEDKENIKKLFEFIITKFCFEVPPLYEDGNLQDENHG